MQSAGVKRPGYFLAAIGIYEELPGAFGRWNRELIREILERYRRTADLIEVSGLNYTILRPTSWHTNNDEIDCTITQKGDPVTETEILRRRVADLIVSIIRGTGTAH
jgi:hypothetical protein